MPTVRRRVEEMSVLDLLTEYNDMIPRGRRKLVEWKSAKRRLQVRVLQLRAERDATSELEQVERSLVAPDWPYRLFSREEYARGIEEAKVRDTDIVKVACEKLLAVVIGTRTVDIEQRDKSHKYKGTVSAECTFGIPYELILDFLAERFPGNDTTYSSLRWYMVRLREMSGQTGVNKKATPRSLDSLKIGGAAILPDRRERMMRKFMKGDKS